uniref:Uncharacterized protein n=1 Tax=Kalanchoe fedtschenkoi TaxID=63787 RepID=A0A7N0V2R0_KALFE
MGLEPRRDFKSLAYDWFSKSSSKSQLGVIRMMCFGIGLWEIWKCRCEMMFGDSDGRWVPPDLAIRSTARNTIFAQMQNFTMMVRASVGKEVIISKMGLQIISVKRKRACSANWTSLPSGITANLAIKDQSGAAIIGDPSG